MPLFWAAVSGTALSLAAATSLEEVRRHLSIEELQKSWMVFPLLLVALTFLWNFCRPTKSSAPTASVKQEEEKLRTLVRNANSEIEMLQSKVAALRATATPQNLGAQEPPSCLAFLFGSRGESHGTSSANGIIDSSANGGTCGGMSVRAVGNGGPGSQKFSGVTDDGGMSVRAVGNRGPGSQKFYGLRPDPLSSHKLPTVPYKFYGGAQGLQRVGASQQEIEGVVGLKECIENHPEKLCGAKYDELRLLRFLRARKGNVQEAAKMFWAAAAFREEVDADSVLTKWDLNCHIALDAYWKPMGLLGRDLDGDPIIWERLGNCSVGSLAAMGEQAALLHEVYTLEHLVAALNEEMARQSRPILGFTVVEDVAGLSRDHLRWDGLKLFQVCTRCDEDFYPEFVKRVLVINAPWIFPAVWKIVQHFFDEGTRNKIQIVGQKETETMLLKYISRDNILACFGGTLRVAGDDRCDLVISPGGPAPSEVTANLRKQKEERFPIGSISVLGRKSSK